MTLSELVSKWLDINALIKDKKEEFTMELMKRAKYVLSGEEGAVSLEMVGWIAVITFIIVAVFLLRDQIVDAIGRGGSAVDDIEFGDPDY